MSLVDTETTVETTVEETVETPEAQPKKIYYDDKERTANALEKIAEIQNNFTIHKQTDKRIAIALEKLVEDGVVKHNDLVKVIRIKGSVANYTDLPENPEIGDMYNIVNADPTHEIKAGDNVVWVGEVWDNFGGYISSEDLGNKWVKDVDGDGEYSLQGVKEGDITGNTVTGMYAHAEGSGTTASAIYSHAEGAGSRASNNQAHAEGQATTASGVASHAEGVVATASGTGSHAEGGNTKASGENSHAEGYSTKAYGTGSHAEGYSTKAYGTGSHAEGYGTAGKSSDSTIGYAHAEGYLTTASSHASHAEGKQTTATNSASHAEGNSTTASGTNSHAEGNGTTASGTNSHAEGQSTLASYENSHAEGYSTTASGQTSHAEGEGTTAARRCQHVFGSFNITDSSGSSAASKGAYIEIVGNGTAANAKSNARTLDWNGNETLKGSITLGKGTNDEASLTAAELKALKNNSDLMNVRLYKGTQEITLLEILNELRGGSGTPYTISPTN